MMGGFMVFRLPLLLGLVAATCVAGGGLSSVGRAAGVASPAPVAAAGGAVAGAATRPATGPAQAPGAAPAAGPAKDAAADPAEVPPLLDDAIQKLIADVDHWAYTVTTQAYDKSGHPSGGPTVERYDPSRPYAQAWTLFRFEGRLPTDAERNAWRRAKERDLKRRQEKSFGDYLDLVHARPTSESAKSVTYLVPLVKAASKRWPLDKIQVFMEVDRSAHALVAFRIQPREPFRIAGVFKLDSGYVEGRLEAVQPKFAPALVWWRGSGSGHVLGIFRLGMGSEANYSAFRRVKPYADRFDVKIGDVKALNF
jgi:hypothetical protein